MKLPLRILDPSWLLIAWRMLITAAAAAALLADPRHEQRDGAGLAQAETICPGNAPATAQDAGGKPFKHQ